MVIRTRRQRWAPACALLGALAWLGSAGNAGAQAPPADEADPSAPPAAEPPSATPPPAADPVGAAGAPAPPPSAAPPPAQGLLKARELQLQVALGGEFFIFAHQAVGNGPALKLSAHWLRWWGPFLLGGGPSIHYSYMFENKEPTDEIHQLTLNGDLIIGGGILQKFAVYAHLLLGFGMASAYDGETRSKITMFWARAVVGCGAWVHLTRSISVGALVDLGWPGTVEVLATASFHFGKTWR